MAEIDFITAFGRLLRDGKLRDEFAVNPGAVAQRIRLRESDLITWLQLNPVDVELQADVLLRKRLDMVKYFAPETCRKTGERLWQEFRKFGRETWPPESTEKIMDAFQFCRRLMQNELETLVQSEWNRLNFAVSDRRIALHWIRMSGAKKRPGFQIFLRTSNERWREFFFYLGL